MGHAVECLVPFFLAPEIRNHYIYIYIYSHKYSIRPSSQYGSAQLSDKHFALMHPYLYLVIQHPDTQATVSEWMDTRSNIT